jgi:hypothetical protein
MSDNYIELLRKCWKGFAWYGYRIYCDGKLESISLHWPFKKNATYEGYLNKEFFNELELIDLIQKSNFTPITDKNGDIRITVLRNKQSYEWIFSGNKCPSDIKDITRKYDELIILRSLMDENMVD